MKTKRLLACALISASLPAGADICNSTGDYYVVVSTRLDRCNTKVETYGCHYQTQTSYNMTILTAPMCQNY